MIENTNIKTPNSFNYIYISYVIRMFLFLWCPIYLSNLRLVNRQQISFHMSEIPHKITNLVLPQNISKIYIHYILPQDLNFIWLVFYNYLLTMAWCSKKAYFYYTFYYKYFSVKFSLQRTYFIIYLLLLKCFIIQILMVFPEKHQ